MGNYLITGGAGFIGSHLAEELANRGHAVRIVDNFLTGKRENLASFLNRVDLLEGDIRDIVLCRRALKGMDYVLHHAALSSVPHSIQDPLLTNEINVTGTLNLLQVSHKERIRRFVLASSAAVYGDSPALPKKEGFEGKVLSPYAVSKLAGEKYCQLFSRIFGLSTVCLRYFNVFGPRQDPFSPYAAVIPDFINKMIHGDGPVIYGDGEQTRDFVFVSDAVEANLLASAASGVSGEVINIACGKGTTVNKLVAEINKILAKDIRPSYDQPRPEDIRHSLADISKAGNMLKYKPRVPFREGLRKTVRAFQVKDVKNG